MKVTTARWMAGKSGSRGFYCGTPTSLSARAHKISQARAIHCNALMHTKWSIAMKVLLLLYSPEQSFNIDDNRP